MTITYTPVYRFPLIPYGFHTWESYYNDMLVNLENILLSEGYSSLNVINVFSKGAVGDGTTDDTAAIQAAIDACNDLGGGVVFLPPVSIYYKITAALVLYSNIEFCGSGYLSRIHSTNTTRLNGITATGTAGSKLSRINVHDLRITAGSADTFPATVDTGNGINFWFCDDCQLYNLYVSNWSDGGITVGNGDRNNIHHNNVKFAAQNIQVVASTIDSNDNIIANNISGATNFYNGIHTEGHFGGPGKTGIVKGTIVTGNTSTDSMGQGINIEVSYGTIVSNNRVTGAGTGGGLTIHGIFLFGGPNSVVTGNEIENCAGYGVVIGANSGETVVSGNTTKSNITGSCLCTDSSTAVSQNIAMGINSWTEGDITITEVSPGNVTFLNRTYEFKFSNLASSDLTTLDWYEEKSFTPIIVGSTGAGTGTYSEQIGTATRIGNVVHYHLQLAWSAHDGTGNITITGLPWTPANTQRFAATVYEGGVPITAGNQMEAYVDQGAAVAHLAQCDPTTGLATAVPMVVSSLGVNIAGTYMTYDS